MGLDAVVYKNPRVLLEKYGLDIVEVDHRTGEAYARPGVSLVLPSEDLVAEEQRLGNVAHVASLRRTIEGVITNANSVILDRVLYSGTHSGDIVTVGDVPRLKEEISLLEKIDNSDLVIFVTSLKSLVAASERENNPIVFV